MTTPTDIAIIGLALRFPGSDTLPQLWGHLEAGRSLITEVDAERWSKERYFGDPRNGGEKTNSVWAGFVEHADRFDAAFFAISPREAETMDPQQRFALELSWKAIEDAGYRPSALAGSRTGVFMGVCHADYLELIERDNVPTDAYFPTGTAYSIVANRVSYFFDLHGPSIANDTACSSSLVSVYEAVTALHNGDCDLALAGGVNLAWSPKLFVAFAKAGMLSPTGTSHAFDQDANGFVRGEGGAVLLLKPLDKALADNDPIHAVIKAAGTNHGGKTNSLTVTNPAAQATLIEDVYRRAGVAPETVTYIEAHGPGTPVGDPIEVVGLKRAFQSLHDANGTTPQPNTTGIGSIKTNIGHLESAAGVAGMVKVVGAMAAGVLPATVNFKQQNRLVDLRDTPFYIVGGTQDWAVDGIPRRAGVSSFGFGGTNAHVLLEEVAQPPATEAAGPFVVPLSAKNAERLQVIATQLREHILADSPVIAPQSLADIAFTLQHGREPLAVRTAFVVADLEQLADALENVTAGEVRVVVENPDLKQLAETWVGGETVEWPQEGRRTRLPTYPFARDRHWYVVPPSTPTTTGLHPLVHRNTSDLAQQRYSSTFTGDEPFLASHVVRGRKVLPAVAYLEAARAAVEDAAKHSVVLRNVTWLRPVIVTDPAEVHIGLTPRGDAIDFEFRQDDTVHCTGSAETGSTTAPDPLQLDALRKGTKCDIDEVYAGFRVQGLEYGPRMRALVGLQAGNGEALAHIRSDDTAGFVLPPSVLDAAFQTSVFLVGETEYPTLAFALDQIEVFGPCPAETFAWVRRSADSGALQKFDIDLCDGDGVIIASLRGLAQRTTDSGPRVVTATTQWIDRPVQPNGSRVAHILTLPDIHAAHPADGIDAAIAQVFAEVQDLLKTSPKDEHRFVAVVDSRVPVHFHEPLVGLFRTVAQENPNVTGRVVRIAAPSEQIVRDELADDSADSYIRYLPDGTRQVQEPVETRLGAGPRVPDLREGGVYWITGGLGGIGTHLAAYLERAGATVVLSGRSASDAANYLQVDVTDAVAVKAAVAQIVAEHGSLNGVVHAAGVLRDQYLLRKDLDEVEVVTAPKIRGTLHLDAATRHLDLDFFAVFSSIASVYGSAGQSDYAAANAFLDGFAAHRQALVDAGERSGKTVALSWPLWADGGMTLDEVSQEAQRRERGWEPLPTEDGLRAFGRAIQPDAPAHVVVAYGADATLAVQRSEKPIQVTNREVSGDLQERTEELIKNVVAEVLRHAPENIESTANLVEYGIDSLAILDMTARLEKHFGQLSKTIFFEYLNVADVAAYFIESKRAQLEALFGVEEPPVVEQAPAVRFNAVEREQPSDRHDIAIIGVSGRYPGAETMDELWDVLANGRHTFEEIPADRWDHRRIYDTDRAAPGKSVIRTGTFLRDIDKFDPRYFRISKREAERMSPEVRLFLQAGVEALEDAGYSRDEIHRKYAGDVGVLVGTMSNHYNLYGYANNLTSGAPASGSYTGTIPNMLSYFYGLTGPSIFLDTMCSASSTCIHQAVHMLRSGETKMVVAGGVNLLLHPYNLISSSQEHFTTGTSDVIRSFGHGVDGTILGEGVGAVVLKPLVDAQRDGDHVYAVIKGTALSNAGVRNGFTVPNPGQQARAVEKAAEDAGIDLRTISYVEAHGSGTALGDPIEMRALTSAFRKYTSDSQFCAIGSVKSNSGHLLAAAGVIGLAKVLLQFQHRKLVPSLHSTELNPDIDFTETPFVVQQSLTDWPSDGPRRAGITSIGAGGMNSHIILEEYPAHSPRTEPFGEQLFVFSAMHEAALTRYLETFREYLASTEDCLPDIAYTLRVGKNALAHRWAFVARDKQSALDAIDRYLAGSRDLPAHELGARWVGGKSVDWSQLPVERRVSLPAYPFERVRCWVEMTEGAPSVLEPLNLRERLHPFLGRNESDVRGLRYVTDIRLEDLLDYQVDKTVVSTFVIDLALAVAKVSGYTEAASVYDLRVVRPIDWTTTTQLVTTFADGHGVVSTEHGPAVEFSVRPAVAPSGRIDVARAVRVERPRFQQDHVRRNVTVEPHVLAAIAQASDLPINRVDEIHVQAGADVAYVLVDGSRIVLAAATGDIVGTLSGVHRGSGGTTSALPRQTLHTVHVRDEGSFPKPHVEEHSPHRSLEGVVERVRGIAAGLLKFEPHELDTRIGLEEFGFDSVSLVAFAQEIHEQLGVKISPAVFFDVRTLDGLAAHIADDVVTDTVATPAPAPVRVEKDPRQPIAIIGAAGRFPGARNLDEFWANLLAGKDSVEPFPLHRYTDKQREAIRGQEFPKHMGALQDVDAFDAAFFKILPREAELMDPQHRIVLETVWQALEDSAYRPADLPSNTGLFVGVTGNDYATLLATEGVAPDAFTSTGTTHSILANRISYLLDVRGPSEPIDTACSSSLVAVHRAMEAIRSGACEMALAGGVNVLLDTGTFISAHRAGMLSPDGRCKTFDASANGYVRGEGVGVVVLKSLEAAERDGDAILAVLRGSAYNHGGRANSLTAPNADAQAELVTTAVGDLDPDTIGYIETHGTGTALGDPVEIRALRTAFRRLGRSDDGSCGLGSVKTNIGHLESAAGIAGLLKLVLALRHGVLPATQHVAEINPHIELDGGPFHLVRSTEPWPEGSGPRRAGVSSFGFGGVNAHVVVEEYVAAPQEISDGPVIVPLSARTPEQLTDRVRDLVAHLETNHVSLAEVAWTLQVGREEMTERVAWEVSSRAELIERLKAFLNGDRGKTTDRVPQWQGKKPRRVHLPTYPFAKDRFWIPGSERQPETSETGETLLRVPQWTQKAATSDVRYDHRVVVELHSTKERRESRFRDLSWQLLEKIRDLRTTGTTLVQVDTDELALAGLARTAAKENPRLTVQVISGGDVAENADSADDLIVYRDGVRHVRTWVPATPQGSSTPWRDGGVYLITGGAGGIGAATAKRIAADVQNPTIVLAGRSPANESLLAELHQAGATAKYVRADISRWEEVRRLVAETEPLNGIVHAAGVVKDALIKDKTADQWDDVLGAKVDGLLNLERATAGHPLEFVITYSSGSAITGNPGQSDYATANAFLNEYRHATARTLAVAWPLWADGGMQVSPQAKAYLRKDRGLVPMPTEAGLTALVDAWNTGAEQVWVHHGDTPPPVRQQVQADPNVLNHLLATFAEVTGLAPNQVDADKALIEVGLDSVMVIQLNQELAKTYPAVSSTIFYEQPTLRAVADQLAGRKHTVVTEKPRSTDEPIAIIGVSGRYPGAADLDEFWQNLSAGKETIREIDRWPLDGFFEPDRDQAVATGRSYSKWGGFLDDFAAFDPRFFGIAPRDAYAMDPQERLFVQAAWEVLEDAGYTRKRLAHKHNKVGVFAGVTKVGHARHGVGTLPSGELVVPCLSFASLSQRASFLLDLRGPSLTIDTMCSASLTAIHEACEQLRRGECEAAIAGGVNLYTHPLDYVELCRAGMLSPDQHCRSFGTGGAGFVPGEGVGAVLLKPLSKALEAGDRVLAVIRGTSVNHGGRSTGYTVPSPTAQASLIRQALDKAGVSARQVSYVEAHGTGTELGDPIEISGLTTAFEQDTTDRQFCAIGSVKSGIGHLEAAAGVAGLTKVLLQLKHQQLAPSLHAETVNPNIVFERTPFRIQRELSPWTSNGPRIAAVSSFGAGGSNAHVIVEEYPVQPSSSQHAGEQVVVLSARTSDQLDASIDRLADYLDHHTVDLGDLAHTLQTGREPMAERFAVAVSSTAELRSSLRTRQGHRGTATESTGLLAELTGDADLQELLIQRWIAAGKLAKLAALWASGVEVDWERLHSTQRRVVSLPTYPFAKDRFWIGDLTSPAAQPVVEIPKVVEPVVQQRSVDVSAVVRETIATALAMEVDEIQGGLAFADYGLDSILAVRVVHQLNDTLALDLSTSVVFDFATADRLAEHIRTEYGDRIAPVESVVDIPEERPAVSGGRGPIAVVGMSGRFASADSLDELWQHLANGDDLVTETSRFDLNGVSKCTRGGFLKRIDEFDAMFFTVSGTEALVMDPQQRLLLEESWKALEDAGYAGSMGNRRCGVYVGAWAGDYHGLLDDDGPAQTLWGNMTSVIPSRVSYFLDLKGPAIAVDTSCSSSLVAIDLACKDLWSGETSMALAGGVFLQSTPRLYRLAGNAGMLSPTGRCHTFDHRADGFVPGEGVGVIVLKRLADALADGDHIHGVIKATGVNSDGATNGITAPSSVSQEGLLRETYERFGVDVDRIGLVEAHGTGTKLGDPIEFQALNRAFRAQTDRTEYCAVGSLKTNIGHTQFAAGVAGVIKVLLALKHQQIPASLHFERANDAIPLAGSPFYLATRTHRWEAPADGPRTGVVSSFGASGTNAHVVIEEAPVISRTVPRMDEWLIQLSARTQDELQEQKRRLAAHIRANPVDLGDLAYTLAVGRKQFTHKFACVVRTLDELARTLDGTLPARTSTVQPPAQGRRIPLPTYPFTPERFWPTVEKASKPEGLVLTNADSLLRDHVVQGKHILPAVAYLDIARKELGADRVRLRNVTWVRPLEVEGRVDVQMTLRGTRFEIGTNNTISCEGTITHLDEPRPPRVDLNALLANHREIVSGSQIHDALVEMGINHGPSLRAIQKAYVGADVVVAELVLPHQAERTPLAPAMLDSAIQAAVAAYLGQMQDTAVPFALNQLDLFAPCTQTMWAVVRGTDAGPAGQLDIDLLDADGEVCVRLTGYRPRRTSQAKPVQLDSMFAPVWDPINADQTSVPSAVDRVLMVGGNLKGALHWWLPPTASLDEVTAAVRELGRIDHLIWYTPESTRTDAQAATDSVTSAFRMIKALLATGYDARPLGITLATTRTLPTHPTDQVEPTHAGLHGLFGSLQREYANWTVRRVDLDSAEWPSDVFKLPAGSPDDAWVHRAGQWLGRHWAPTTATAKPVYRRGGVYIVIGGAGGLGQAWTKHVVDKHGAEVVWIGRSPHSQSIEDKARAIGNVRYISADAGDPVALRQAIAQIGKPVHGVVQAALVLRDSTFARMDEAGLKAALAAKIDVTTAVAEAFPIDQLDFAVLLSSMQTFTTAAGQGNYAAGCTFADAYAHSRGFQVMNWGWWGSLGSVTSDFYSERLSRVGLVSIEPEEGIAALDALLGGDQPQLAYIKTNEHNTLANFDRATKVSVHDRTPSRVRPEKLVTTDIIDGLVDETVRWRTAERDPWIANVMSAQLATIDFADVQPAYAEWLVHAQRVLVPAEPVATAFAGWEQQCAKWSVDPSRAAELRLATACLKALPDIVTGRVRATDVMFPRGSVELVEGTYRDNEVADVFNRAMHRAALGVVQERLRQEPNARLRILEIGAGTGGTSKGMFAVLKPYQDSIETYVYTDLSKAFLNHARTNYGPIAPYLDPKILNIEKPLDGQDIPEGSFDIVIAANVLHATRDTRNTLRNAKAAMRAGGWLLLNELCAFDLFSHVTFGLLEGWWLFDDRTLRIPGSPALSPESWRDTLAGEGFGTVEFLLPQARGLGQQVIAAESDGVARQGVPYTPQPRPAIEVVSNGAKSTFVQHIDTNVLFAPKERDLVEIITGKAAAVLGIPAERIDPAASLIEYGLDSILVLQLTNALREDFGDDVSSTLVYDVESVNGLCAHFGEATAGEHWNLAQGQLRMYEDQRRWPSATNYHLPLLFELHGGVNETALRQAIAAQTEIHPVLSAIFGERDGVPFMDIDPNRTPTFDRVEIQSASRVAQIRELRKLVNAPFDLATGPLVRTHLIDVPGRKLLLITVHHILLDGTSVAVLVRTLKEAYQGKDHRPRATFGEFVRWEEALLASEKGQRHRDYWVRELQGPRKPLALPFDRPLDPERLPDVEVLTGQIPAVLAGKLADKAREHKVSVATVLFTTFATFLRDLTGQDDLVLGLTTAARHEERFQDVAGQIATVLPIRITDTELKSVHRKLIAGIEHSALPLREISRAVGDDAVVLTNFLFQNFDGADLLTHPAPAGPGELDLRAYDDLPYPGEYTLSAEFYRDGDGYKVFLKYDANVFREATARAMLDEWITIVENVA